MKASIFKNIEKSRKWTTVRDTNRDAALVHRAVLDRLGVSGRARMVFELSDSVRAFTESGVRNRHPEYSDRQVKLAAIRLSLGARLFKLAFPGQDVQL